MGPKKPANVTMKRRKFLRLLEKAEYGGGGGFAGGGSLLFALSDTIAPFSPFGSIVFDMAARTVSRLLHESCGHCYSMMKVRGNGPDIFLNIAFSAYSDVRGQVRILPEQLRRYKLTGVMVEYP